MAAVQAVCDSFAKHVLMVIVYICEAHPQDGWGIKSDADTYGVCYKKPTTLQERQNIALRLLKELCPDTTVVVDPINNAFELAYEARPERLYVLDSKSLSITYQSGPGPFMYSSDKL